MQTGKKYGMQSLDDHLLELLQQRKISAEDAYINCMEKQKFVKFLKKAPADFTEV
jgi:twitching motility protein PilT